LPTTFDRDIVELLIDGKAWRHWDDLEIHRGFDTNPSIGFSAPFDVERADMRDTFEPFTFKPLGLTVGGEQLFTGTLVDVTPRTEADAVSVACSGYSLPGVLEDSNLPADKVPFEASGLTLHQVAERLAGYFGIEVLTLANDGAAFKKVKTRQKKTDTRFEHEQKIDEFLVELAKQRGLIRSSDELGRLVFWDAVPSGNPVARLTSGMAGVVSIVPTFNPQDYYSEITGFTTVKRGALGAKFTQRNTRLAGGVLRSMSFKLEDVEKGDAPHAVAAKLGRMFASACSIVVNLASWRGPNGEIWKPNTTVVLNAPGSMIYSDYEFLVRDVYLKESAGEKTASIGLVIPESFRAGVPARLPWESIK
jgi:prophage tail gpP-like protein